MAGEFDAGTPTLQVNVYEDGALIAQVAEDLGLPSEEVRIP